MNTIIVYSSQSGFTEKYANWLGDRLSAKVMKLDEAKKISSAEFDKADAVIYGGWVMAGKPVGADWFLKHIPEWKEKKLVLFCVGGCPGDAPDIEDNLKNALTDEQRQYVKAFYCQGGFNYERMGLPSKLAMKAFASMINKKKDKTEEDRIMGEMITHSYDISDEKFLDPIVAYINGEK